MAKILAVNGSPRREGNTAAMLGAVLSICEGAGHDTELYQAGGRTLVGCKCCGGCTKHHGRCATDDWINELYEKMVAADAILLGSPTYFSDLSPETKVVIDRCGYVSRGAGESTFSRKIGVGVSAVRRAGGIHTLDSIQHFFLINNMITIGSDYWNMSLARGKGDYAKDEEGVRTMEKLGKNLVWLLEKLA